MHQVDRDEGATKTGKLKRVMMPMTMMLKKLAMIMVEGFRAMMMMTAMVTMERTTKPDTLFAPLFLVLFFSTMFFCSFPFYS